MKRFTLIAGMILIAALVASGWTGTPATSPEKVLDKNLAKMVATLQHENLEKRAEAAQKLGEKCCKDAVPYLVKMMQEDAVPGARIVAANALAKIGDLSIIPKMLEQARVDKNKTVRYSLTMIAEEMNKKKTESAG